MRFRCSIRQIIPKLCAASLALLGFSCGSVDDNDDEILLMYGSPYGTYEIKGSVTTEDGKPVKGAVVRVTNHDLSSDIFCEADTTGTSGEYMVKSERYVYKAKKVVCVPDDPTLEADSTVVELKFSGGKEMWDMGHAEATVDFKLRKKSGE